MQVRVYCSNSALGVARLTALQHKLKVMGGKTVTIHVFPLYLTKHLSVGAQWTSERIQGFIADFCYSIYVC